MARKKVYGTNIQDLIDIEKFFYAELNRDIRICFSTKGPELLYNKLSKEFVVNDPVWGFQAYDTLIEAYMKWADLMNRE